MAGVAISFAGYLFVASRMLASCVRALPAFAAYIESVFQFESLDRDGHQT